MKLKYIQFIFWIFFLHSCNVLDKEPIDIISDSQVWEDENLVDANLTQLYNITYFSTVFDLESKLITVTDEARECFGWGTILNTYTHGIITPDNISNRDFVGFWEYGNIRQYNEFLENISTSTSLNSNFVVQRMAEVRFLRALHYYNLVMRLGGVPIITRPQQMNDNNIFISRNTEKEVYEFIRKELDEIIEILPISYDADNIGRITKYTALALKSRAMLYAASIAKNGKMDLNGIIGVPQADANFYFEESMKASQKILSDKKFSLYNKYPNDKSKNYQYLFLDKNNNEVIFSKKYTVKEFGHDFDYYNQPISYKPFVASCVNPTLEMVDSYEFIDGMPGTSINYNQEIETKELYKNKEPRFHASILYNQAFWIDKEVETHYFTINSNINTDKRDNSLGGRGKDVNNTIGAGATQTGFLIKKYLREMRDVPIGGYSDTDFIVFRLGEVYLNLAEAAFELGNTDEAIAAINKIRERAGVPLYTEIDQEKIRHERKIELAFEGLRYWDVRRWRTAHIELSGVFHKLNTYYIKERNTFGYLIVNCQGDVSRKFAEQHYYFPLERKHITENPNIVQNPGYN